MVETIPNFVPLDLKKNWDETVQMAFLYMCKHVLKQSLSNTYVLFLFCQTDCTKLLKQSTTNTSPSNVLIFFFRSNCFF
jgi:hypothetical protein